MDEETGKKRRKREQEEGSFSISFWRWGDARVII